ncbi:MAG TPA: VCBS repeat-containing protein, partial [Thermoanaerobaculia bacterium]|nr:VCBS repeat-containing protein [Thermoanaerobaculia bacterium]
LAPPVAAQGALQGTGQWIEPSPTTAGQFERADRGDFDGDAVSDMVVQRGTSLEVLLAPGLYDQSFIVPGVFTAYGVCPIAPTRTRSLLLVSSALGLEQVELDVASGTWSSTLIAASWTDAALIEVHDMVYTVAVLGVMADQRTVRCLYRVEGEWFEQPVLVHPEPIRDLTVFEFDGAGQIEIAVASDSALWVYDSVGTLRKSFPVGDAESVAIGRLDLPLSVRDGLAWVVTRSEGIQQLIVLSPKGLQTPQHLSTMPLVVDMETGDLDQDGDSDIVLSHTIEHSVIVLLNIGNGWLPAFDVKSSSAVRKVQYGPEGVPAPENRARPKLADVDGDEDNDLLMPVQSSGELFVWRSGTVEQDAFEPEVDLAVLETACNLESLGNGDIAMHLQVAVDLPENATATHLEFVVWRRASPDDPTEPMAVDYKLVPIAGNDPQSISVELTLPQVPDLIPGTNVRFDGMYLWLQRAVRVVDSVSYRWPARVYALETSPDPQNYSWIKSIGGKMLFPVHECASGATLPDLIGCGSELPKLPEFPGGKVPTWI